ncbi:SDR family oxidoreductase [Streptococcus sp. 121]|uniref:NAD-dependent epimerase/dehydratase family protein n=1 Tax=Streptococcus sp. 121 TaxID=2797637 RepID=UPI0018F0F3D4|nr:SDR family oxidoreductase [Streptococcus sp. 121]MBJ6746665.1 SDR family oxidoreductase [Streptococcus sp. 121]
MSNILITGGCGYIGSRVVEHLVRYTNHNLIIFDSGLFGFNSISEFMDSDRVQLIVGDIRIQEKLQKAMKDVDIVIHLAGIVGEPACIVDENISYDINVFGTQNVLKSAKKSGVKEFLFASSCSVYGFGNELFFENSIPNPVDSYAEMKLASELDIENYKETMRISVLRFCTVFGASNRMRFDLAVNVMTANAVVNNEIQVYGGQQERPFIHCSDIARAVELVIKKRHIDEPYIVF